MGEIDLKKEISGMKIKEIKEELDNRGLGYQDIFEKTEYIQRLYEARINNVNNRGKTDSKAKEQTKREETSSKSTYASNGSNTSNENRGARKAQNTESSTTFVNDAQPIIEDVKRLAFVQVRTKNYMIIARQTCRRHQRHHQ